MDKKNRLTSVQKLLLDTILKNNIFDDLILPDDISFKSIDLNNIKLYNETHNKINQILKENNIEPHEIYDLIENYDGSHLIFNTLKKFIMIRNLSILKRVFKTEKWNKNIEKIYNIFKTKYSHPVKIDMLELINKIILDILIKDINMFDITQCKIKLDSKNNIKLINITSIEDQKKIISFLLENGCIKI
jgi:hypothetical protein